MERYEKMAYTIREAAEITGLSTAYLYKLSALGKLPVCKVGSRVVILGSELDAWLKSKIRYNAERIR